MQVDVDNIAYSRQIDATTIKRSGQRSEDKHNVLRESTVDVYINNVQAMRITCTPTNVYELVVGRLYSEGYISSINDIKKLDFAGDLFEVNILLIREDAPEDKSQAHLIATTGGSGEVRRRYAFNEKTYAAYGPVSWDKKTIFNLYDSFALDTPLHSLTKGTHSCRLAVDGELVFIAEDIGRHNTIDKAVGYALMHNIDINRTIFFCSGRLPVDMVSKAIRARIPILASKAAPTDQAVVLAQKYGLTLICLVNDEQLVVFSGVDFESETS